MSSSLPLEPYDGPWGEQQVLHLLRRTVSAPTLAEVRSALTLDRDALVDQLLDAGAPLPIPNGWLGELVTSPSFPWYDRRFDLNDAFRVDLRRWWYDRMLASTMSVRERLTLFWHNHFATNGILLDDPRLSYLQNQTLRRHALGSFRDLVRGVTIDKAMLAFLDGRHNKAGTVNENYARELQELFTVGIAANDGTPNYSQRDIVEAARALTGWDWIGFGVSGDVVSNPITGHDSSSKQVYGQTIPGSLDGGPELERLVDIVLDHPETARSIVRKLYRFLVHTDAPLTPFHPIDDAIESQVIVPLAQVFRESQWSIAAVLRVLLRSNAFHTEDVVGAMIKSPVDFCLGLIRGTLSGTVTSDARERMSQAAQRQARALGMDVFLPPGVQGWQFHRSWISTSTLPQRHQFAEELIGGVDATLVRRPNALFPDIVERSTAPARIDLLAYARQFATFDDPEELVVDIARHQLAHPASSRLVTRLVAELVGDRSYEWASAPETFQRLRLEAMMRTLVRSANYQLM
jgi:uncharacterized protein (DUF1800 family)